MPKAGTANIVTPISGCSELAQDGPSSSIEERFALHTLEAKAQEAILKNGHNTRNNSEYRIVGTGR